MKRTVLPAVILMAISIITLGTIIGASSGAKDPTTVITNNPFEQAASVTETPSPVVTTIQLTPKNSAGNWRDPGVAEDSQGNRLAIFRNTGGRAYAYVYCPKGGTWSAPKDIPHQPVLIRTCYATIVVDSTDRFHCEWEDARGAVYASFKDGAWTTPVKPSLKGRYDLNSSITVDRDDAVITVDCEIQHLSKDIFIHRKPANATKFEKAFDLTRDPKLASTQPSVAVDSKNTVWLAWKSEYHIVNNFDNLVCFLAPFRPDNKDGEFDWMLVSPDPDWAFYPQVAVNSEDKVMTLCSSAHTTQYVSRLFDPATKKMSDLIPLNIGLCKRPWCIFYSRLVAHGKDFYAAVINPSRMLLLMKFDEATSKWNTVTQVSNTNVEQWAMYSGYDKLLIAWGTLKEPEAIYLTTVDVDPYSNVYIKSIGSPTVVKKEERTFFHAYYLNLLTWTANSYNTEKGITITAQNIYRKARTEDSSKWVKLTSVSETVFSYTDTNNITASSDFVYTITCVDDKGHESKIE